LNHRCLYGGVRTQTEADKPHMVESALLRARRTEREVVDEAAEARSYTAKSRFSARRCAGHSMRLARAKLR